MSIKTYSSGINPKLLHTSQHTAWGLTRVCGQEEGIGGVREAHLGLPAALKHFAAWAETTIKVINNSVY